MKVSTRMYPIEWLPLLACSYGGSPEVVKAFTCIPRVGSRFYFSFSSVINASKGQQEKLIQRMHAVPDDRLLIE